MAVENYGGGGLEDGGMPRVVSLNLSNNSLEGFSDNVLDDLEGVDLSTL